MRTSGSPGRDNVVTRSSPEIEAFTVEPACRRESSGHPTAATADCGPGRVADTSSLVFPRRTLYAARERLRPNVQLHVHLHRGRGQFAIYAADLTEEYVALNKGDVNDPSTLGG